MKLLKKISKKAGETRRNALPRGMRDPLEGVTARGSSFRGSDPAGLVLTIVLALVVAGAGLFRVWTRSEVQRLGYAIVEAEGRMRTAEADRARLTVEEATLSSPIRIAAVAESRLGLKSPRPEQIVDLRSVPSGSDTEIAALAKVKLP